MIRVNIAAVCVQDPESKEFGYIIQSDDRILLPPRAWYSSEVECKKAAEEFGKILVKELALAGAELTTVHSAVESPHSVVSKRKTSCNYSLN